MRKLTQTKGFNLGFWGCMLPFLIINCLSYIDAVKYTNAPIQISGCNLNGGFPISMFGGCYGNPDSLNIYWLNLITNLLIALVFSVLSGRIIKTVWSNSTSQ
jgi:hypothetical protein